MTKIELARHMAAHFRARADVGLSRPLDRNDAYEFLSELQRCCQQELEQHGRTSIPGIVKLFVQHRPSRRGRNIRTGQAIAIPASNVIRARISSRMGKPMKDVRGP